MKDKKDAIFFSVRISKNLKDRIMKFLEHRDLSKSDFCRIAWEKFIKGEK